MMQEKDRIRELHTVCETIRRLAAEGHVNACFSREWTAADTGYLASVAPEQLVPFQERTKDTYLVIRDGSYAMVVRIVNDSRYPLLLVSKFHGTCAGGVQGFTNEY